MIESTQKDWNEDYRERPKSLRLPADAIKDRIIFDLVKRDKRKDRMLLELGCGLGFTAFLLSDTATVIGVDYSREGVTYASKRARARFICADASHLPFKNEAFDFVIAKDIFEHLDNDMLAFQELERVSKKNAKLISYLPQVLDGLNFSIESLIKKITGYTLDVDVGHVRRYTPQNIKKVFSNLNFSIISYWYFAHLSLGLIGLLGVILYKKIKRKKAFFSPSPKVSMVKLFFKLFEYVGRFESAILKKLPGAGFFIIARKN